MPDKEATLKLVEQEYGNLRQTVDGLERPQMERVWFGTWSAKDIIAHVLGWEREMTEALRRMARGEKPAPEGVDYSQTDDWNAKFSLAMKQQLATTVLAEWAQVHMDFVKAARALPDDRFGEGKTANRILENSGYGHYREHAKDIREWRQREGI